MFSESNLIKYVLMIGLVITASLFSNKFNFFAGNNDENELIRKYLLNDNPLYGFNKPKMWIHTKYEYNARVWKSFGSRSSHDLNQPYIHLTVKTIINHCGKDFNICLIDDESFQQLIPQWTTRLDQIPEPQRQFHRQLALMELLSIYGGFLVPNSFVCVQNLYPLYASAVDKKQPFALERANPAKLYAPDPSFMGAPKRDPVIREYCEYIKRICNRPMLGSDQEFRGTLSTWLATAAVTVVDGIFVGAKTARGRPVLLEDLLQDKDLDVPVDKLCGVVIPADALLSRPKYQWFAVLSAEEALRVQCVASRLLLRGILDEAARPDFTQWSVDEEDAQRETVIAI
jgi:hypothetical protein